MSLGNGLSNNAVRTKGDGLFRLNITTFKAIPNDQAVINACLREASGIASSAASIADEVYTISKVKGKFRTYIRVAGQEPDTGGYWRGKRRQALWTSTRGWHNKSIRRKK